jgi:hypothetical protein
MSMVACEAYLSSIQACSIKNKPDDQPDHLDRLFVRLPEVTEQEEGVVSARKNRANTGAWPLCLPCA